MEEQKTIKRQLCDVSAQLLKIAANSEDMVKVSNGKWISDNLVGWKCSNCNEHIVLNVKIHGNYCPNCGAKMEENND